MRSFWISLFLFYTISVIPYRVTGALDNSSPASILVAQKYMKIFIRQTHPRLPLRLLQTWLLSKVELENWSRQRVFSFLHSTRMPLQASCSPFRDSYACVDPVCQREPVPLAAPRGKKKENGGELGTGQSG